MRFVYQPGQTPLDPDEAAGLIPGHIATQTALNEYEEINIVKGSAWAARQTRREILDESFVRDLHRKMFDQTWRWAGTFRNSDKTIGCDWRYVSVKLRDLLENTKYQIEHGHAPPDEIAVRFHHQLVSIHAFANGNGRHARLMADLLIQRLGQPPFTWGGNSLVAPTVMRTRYIEALQQADRHDISALLDFARS
jgi:Fic-DOC domain mobile mystery protein B